MSITMEKKIETFSLQPLLKTISKINYIFGITTKILFV
jgi:hypothetical protein